MLVLKVVFSAALHAIGGFLAGMVFGFGVGAVVGLLTWSEANFSLVLSVMAYGGAVIGLIIGATKPIEAERQRASAAAEADRQRAVAAAQEEQRQRDEMRRRVASLRRLSSDAEASLLHLPVILAEAATRLGEAEQHLLTPRFSPFWEAMEVVAEKLAEFDGRVRSIAELRTRHQRESAEIRDAPSFARSPAIVPDPAPYHKRAEELYLRAQESPSFAQVYEQRRTNSILIAGFRSLDLAFRELGAGMSRSLGELRSSVEFGVGSLRESVESGIAAAEAQRREILSELRNVPETDKAVLHQLRNDAQSREKQQALLRGMVDNIQRGRRPGFFDPAS